MSQVTLRRTISRIGPLQIAIIVLAVVTGSIHLYRGLLTSSFATRPRVPEGFRPPRAPRPTGGNRGAGTSLLSIIPLPLPILFYLNFFGYITLVTTLYLPALRSYQRLIRWLLIAFAVVTIIAWFLITSGRPDVMAYIDKPIELALVVLLLIEDQSTRTAAG